MAFNFETFGTPAGGTATAAPAGRFSFEGFGEEGQKVKKRSTIGKVAGFLAPSTVRTVEKLTAGEKIGLRDVAGTALEVGSFFIPAGAAVKGATLAARGLGLAGKAVAGQVAKKGAVTLGRRVGQFAAGGAVSGGLAGAGRAVGEGKSASEILSETAGGAAGGAVAGAALPIAGRAAGSVIGRVRGGFAGRAAKEATQKALLEAGEADARIATKALQEGKVVTDVGAKEAVRQGIEEADVALIKTMSRQDKSKAIKMLDLRQKQLTNRRVTERATDVAGDTFIEKVAKPIQNLNRQAGKKLDEVAQSLAGQKVDTSPALQTLAAEFDKAGVKVGAKGKLLFKGSDYEGLRAVQSSLTNIWKRGLKIQRTGDALQAHRTKAFIDNMVEYGAEGSGLTGKAERIVKQFRHNLDAVLDQNFKQYNKVNTVFAETISELNKIGAVLGKRFRLADEFADAQAGLGLRRLMSNTQSRAQILQLIDGMQKVAKKYKIPIDEDVISQAQFANLLEKPTFFGTEAPTSLFGQVERASEQALGVGAEVVKGSPYRAAIKAGKAVYDLTRGVGQENRVKALRELLLREGAEVVKPKTGSLIGKPRLPKGPGAAATPSQPAVKPTPVSKKPIFEGQKLYTITEDRPRIEEYIKKEWGDKIPDDELVDLGTANDMIANEKAKSIFKDVLDIQVVLTEKFERPTIQGQIGTLPNNKLQIQLRRDLTDEQFNRTFTEELLHALRIKKGRADHKAEQLLDYLDRPTEKSAKEGVKKLLGEDFFGLPVRKVSNIGKPKGFRGLKEFSDVISLNIPEHEAKKLFESFNAFVKREGLVPSEKAENFELWSVKHLPEKYK